MGESFLARKFIASLSRIEGYRLFRRSGDISPAGRAGALGRQWKGRREENFSAREWPLGAAGMADTASLRRD